jgi:hypothetical protein
MRDARGKSVRGAMVPRLFIRRLLLPYCTLALSKRDSVPMTCEQFTKLLLMPDKLKIEFLSHSSPEDLLGSSNQFVMPFVTKPRGTESLYEDLTEADLTIEEHT